MTRDEQLIRAALDMAAEVEFGFHDGISAEWHPYTEEHVRNSIRSINPAKVLAGIPNKDLTKPSVDWNHVSREFNFLVRHSPSHGGEGVVLSCRPIKGRRIWVPSDGRECDVECLASYDPGTCDWQDSLVVRPGYKEDTNNGQ